MMTASTVSHIKPLVRPEASTLAATENSRMLTLLRSLQPADWAAQTDCPAWTVRDMAGHVLGMTETFSALRPFVANMRAGGKAAGAGPFIDGLTAHQVKANSALTVSELLERLDRAGPRQMRWRASRRLMRRIPMKQVLADGTTETWKVAFLLDTVLTRDCWMHRIDLSRATGKPMILSADHDGRIVGDVVREWADRHGRPFELELTGPAGDLFVAADGYPNHAEKLSMDAVEFCRVVSRRAAGSGLLAHEVPF